MALPFLKAENEETATQALAFIGICIVTVGLMIMNVSGAIAGSKGGDTLQLVIRGALAFILAGAELIAAVVLVRVMLAPNRLRQVIGAAIFLGLAWACIQNGKKAVHLIYPEFTESPAMLDAKAQLAANEAGLAAEARKKAVDNTGPELEKVREDIADLRAEQLLMASNSPEKIKEAQALLIAQGKYFGRVDGIRRDKTEAAMRARGEEISQSLTRLRLREQSLVDGSLIGTVGIVESGDGGTTTDPAVLQVELEDKARRARAATIWLEVMLWVFEGTRSLGLWALVTTITSSGYKRDNSRDEELKAAEHQRKLEEAAPTPAIPAKPTEPAPVPDDATVRASRGGRANGHMQHADKVSRVPIPSTVHPSLEDAHLKEAAE